MDDRIKPESVIGMGQNMHKLGGWLVSILLVIELAVMLHIKHVSVNNFSDRYCYGKCIGFKAIYLGS